MNMLMPKRPAHTPENADTASRSQGRSFRSGFTGRRERVAISSPKSTTTTPSTVLMTQGMEKRNSSVPGITPQKLAASSGRIFRHWKLCRFFQVIQAFTGQSSSSVPGVMTTWSRPMDKIGAEIRGLPKPISPLTR